MNSPRSKHFYYLPVWVLLLLLIVLLSSQSATIAAENQAQPATTVARMPGHFLTGPNEGLPLDIALDYLRANTAEYNLTAEDVADIIVTSSHTSKHNGVTHIYTRQRVAGLEINTAVTNFNIARDGSVINVGNRYLNDVANKINTTTPTINAATAIQFAAAQLGLPLNEPLVVEESVGGTAQEAVFSSAGISLDPIPVKLMYQPDLYGNLRLAWEMVIYELDAYHWWHLWVDAETGNILYKYDWVTHDDFGFENAPIGTLANHADAHTHGTSAHTPLAGTYNVYPQPVESPIHGDRELVSDPDDTLASPLGWHDDDFVAGADYTVTRGNNTHAYQDLGVPNFPDPFSDAEGGAGLVFDFPYDDSQPFTAYKDAAVTNLFYWTNINHDVYYHYGFTEEAGNFQEHNYGRGGIGGESDYVFAEAQDGSGTDNANFATPVDGMNPRMQMYVWVTTDPGNTIDGDFDAGIIAHEYGHGISIRLTGGRNDVGCMNHTEREGEGWSDWLGLVLTTLPEHTETSPRGVGAFALAQPPDGPGIRAFPYTTDMEVNPQTYADIADASVPHGVGSIWATMIWDLYWAYVNAYGYDADVYNAGGGSGNQQVIQLIFDGMKMQICEPTFVDARDAILAADQATTGGINECMIWNVFARRGLGFSADAGAASSATDGVEAFDLPAQCLSDFTVVADTLSICAPSDGMTTVNLATLTAFAEEITLSADNVPASATTSFSPTTITSLPGSSTLTIGNTGSVTPGTYFVDIIGTAASATEIGKLKLNVADSVPSATTPATPIDGSVVESFTPFFTWLGASQASSYTFELATDFEFTNIIETANDVATTSYQLGSSLSEGTTYFWRVTASNDCGVGETSDVFAFTTITSVCTGYAGLPTLIPASVGATTTATVADDLRITDVNIRNATGTYDSLDSLRWTLTSPAGSVVVIAQRDAYCNDHGLIQQFDIGFDDQAALPLTDAPCPPDDGTSYRPSESLDVFNQELSAGDWGLNLADAFINHAGELTGWTLEICTADSADFSDLFNSYGVAAHSGDGALRTGANWDADTSSALGQDDDNDDGVSFDALLQADEAFAMTVDVTGTATNGVWVGAWFDWNSDGDFADAGEEMFDEAGSVSSVVLNGTVPANATLFDSVNYRVRVYDADSDPTATFDGSTTGGEVTDGAAPSEPTTPTATTLSSTGTSDSGNVLIVGVFAIVLLSLAGVIVRTQK